MKVRLVYNPSAGMKTAREQLARAVDELREGEWSVDVVETTRLGEAEHLARQAAGLALDAVVAVGGDGTMNEVANGVVGTTTALGVLPLGTANVWAKEMGLPLGDLSAGARLLTQAQVCPVDVGQIQGPSVAPRIFVLWCGIGLDAAITRYIEPQREMKRRLGALLFWLVGIREAWGFRGRPVILEMGDVRTRKRVILALAANAQLYGGIVRIAPQAKIDDGLLDLVVFKGTGFGMTALHLVRVFLGLHLRNPQVEAYHLACVGIRGKNLPVQVDGEPVGWTPVDIAVRPRALRILVPKTANHTLFAGS